MEKFINELNNLKSSLTDHEKEFVLYIYISNDPSDEDEIDPDLDDVVIFYINDKETHDKGHLIDHYPNSDLVEKILDLLEAGELMESTYEYCGEKEELEEKIKIICKELPNVIFDKVPWN